MKRAIYWIMAGAAGVVVANNYYNQPLLADFVRDFHTGEREAGMVPVAAQTGYALGLLLFVPLGDRLERRALLCMLLAVASVSLAAIALAPTLAWLRAALKRDGPFSMHCQPRTATRQCVSRMAH